jgi:hypothetical protein
LVSLTDSRRPYARRGRSAHLGDAFGTNAMAGKDTSEGQTLLSSRPSDRVNVGGNRGVAGDFRRLS